MKRRAAALTYLLVAAVLTALAIASLWIAAGFNNALVLGCGGLHIQPAAEFAEPPLRVRKRSVAACAS